MNPGEQVTHRRRTDELERQLQDLEEQTENSLDALNGSLVAKIEDLRDTVHRLVGEERTHRLDLAREQRSYVDAEYRNLWQSIRETDRCLTAYGDEQYVFLHLTFWGRLRWLFTGRLR